MTAPTRQCEVLTGISTTEEVRTETAAPSCTAKALDGESAVILLETVPIVLWPQVRIPTDMQLPAATTTHTGMSGSSLTAPRKPSRRAAKGPAELATSFAPCAKATLRLVRTSSRQKGCSLRSKRSSSAPSPPPPSPPPEEPGARREPAKAQGDQEGHRVVPRLPKAHLLGALEQQKEGHNEGCEPREEGLHSAGVAQGVPGAEHQAVHHQKEREGHGSAQHGGDYPAGHSAGNGRPPKGAPAFRQG